VILIPVVTALPAPTPPVCTRNGVTVPCPRRGPVRGPIRGPLYPPGYPPYISPYAAPYTPYGTPGYVPPYVAPYASPSEACVIEVNGGTDVYVVAVNGVPVSPAIVCQPSA